MHLYYIWLLAFWTIGTQVNLVFTSVIPVAKRSHSATSPALVDATDATYFWPLVGLNLDAGVPWGLNVSVLASTESFSSIYKIVIGDGDPGSNVIHEKPSSSAPKQPQVTAVSTVLQQDNGEIGAISIVNDGTPQVVLGLKQNYSDTNSSTSVRTTPFGINLGQDGVWNGSLTLSGTFDVNRIASPKWMPLRISGDKNYFTSSAQKNASGTIQAINSSMDTDFELDFNSEAIVLPAPADHPSNGPVPACGNDMTVIFNGGETTIFIPGNLTESPDRCYTRNRSDPNSQAMILGRPFLQAAYAYFDENGAIWVTQANQYNLPVNPQPFDSDAALAPPSPPESWELAHPNWYNHLKTSSGIAQYIACLAGFGFLMFVFVALCNGILL